MTITTPRPTTNGMLSGDVGADVAAAEACAIVGAIVADDSDVTGAGSTGTAVPNGPNSASACAVRPA